MKTVALRCLTSVSCHLQVTSEVVTGYQVTSEVVTGYQVTSEVTCCHLETKLPTDHLSARPEQFYKM